MEYKQGWSQFSAEWYVSGSMWSDIFVIILIIVFLVNGVNIHINIFSFCITYILYTVYTTIYTVDMLIYIVYTIYYIYYDICTIFCVTCILYTIYYIL